ncbi:amidase family protein [Paenibacillus tengchongensis]|uniref:amidase family protein n=1 Tax=Paenibacillus tengchongensis TaxID=2608684 RepID=UPI00124D0D76
MEQLEFNIPQEDRAKWHEWLIEADICGMQTEMERGGLTAELLVSLYLERIHTFNPLLKAVLELNSDARELARQLDSERKETGPRSMLHGIPVLLKDNIGTADKLHTSARSLALAASTAAADAAVAGSLRQAGAVILGKTNMTEWANYMSSSMWAGYSSRGGLTLNPYGPGELFVGGSSSGSAVAANLAAAAVGTETSGSIVGPASQNCIVGLKPGAGVVSSAGMIPAIGSQDTARPMTRSVRDAAILLGAMRTSGSRGLPQADNRSSSNTDYTGYFDAGRVKSASYSGGRLNRKGLNPEPCYRLRVSP